jgi:hypothetical protein
MSYPHPNCKCKTIAKKKHELSSLDTISDEEKRFITLLLGLDWFQGRGVEGKAGVAVEWTFPVASRRPNAVDCPSATN